MKMEEFPIPQSCTFRMKWISAASSSVASLSTEWKITTFLPSQEELTSQRIVADGATKAATTTAQEVVIHIDGPQMLTLWMRKTTETKLSDYEPSVSLSIQILYLSQEQVNIKH